MFTLERFPPSESNLSLSCFKKHHLKVKPLVSQQKKKKHFKIFKKDIKKQKGLH